MRCGWLGWVIAALWLAACGDDTVAAPTSTTNTGGTGVGGQAGNGGGGGQPGVAPGPDFDRFCEGRVWHETLSPEKLYDLQGEYLGSIQMPNMEPVPVGMLETLKVVPAQPFRVRKIRLAFGAGSGTARIRLVTTFGRSYPGPWPDMADTSRDLIPPRDIEVKDADPEEWLEIDLAGAEVFLQPTQHYMLVYEHLSSEPYLGLEAVPEGSPSHSLLFFPDDINAYGLEGDYRMQLEGDTFCAWQDDERWFGLSPQPFSDEASPRVAVADLNGDGHDDVIIQAGGPKVYLGAGDGSFAAPPSGLFPDAPGTAMTLFGDVDNDADVDAFAPTYVTPDSDGDKVTIAEGDCRGNDAKAFPGAMEVVNGYDDDCDGMADDGTDTSDMDQDGVSIAAGDCDDTSADTKPGAPEILDELDNDCDGLADEDFGNRMFLNDGTGKMTLVPNAGIEALDPTGAAAFGDVDGDGLLDVYWGNWLEHYPNPKAVPDHLAVGNGDGTFTDVTQASGAAPSKPRACYGAVMTDYNNDGHQDIWVGNYGYGLNMLLENDGKGKLVDVAVGKGVAADDFGIQGGNTFGGVFGDIDNDGDFDLFATNIAHPRYQPNSDPSTLLVNQGAPGFAFVDKREAFGIVYDEGDVNAAFGDYDNDGDLDLAIATLYTGHYSKLYRNDGPEKGFTDVTFETGAWVHDAVSVAWSDVDEDGDLDLLLADRDKAPFVHLFVNRVGQDRAWVALDLEGKGTNRSAYGARVTVEAGGVTQVRDVHGGGGHSNTQQTRILHFGLGDAKSVGKVTVRWVGGGTEAITGVGVSKRYRVVEGSGVAVPVP